MRGHHAQIEDDVRAEAAMPGSMSAVSVSKEIMAASGSG
jgi:hypothetical protein